MLLSAPSCLPGLTPEPAPPALKVPRCQEIVLKAQPQGTCDLERGENFSSGNEQEKLKVATRALGFQILLLELCPQEIILKVEKYIYALKFLKMFLKLFSFK